MNQNRLITGVLVLVVFLILLVSGSLILLKERKHGQARVDHRVPLQSLGYCSSQQVEPCILSFDLDADGKMVITILAGSISSDFHLVAQNGEIETIYECQKVQESSTRVSCLGKAVSPGEVLQFLMISTDGDMPLAEGRFQVIGLALATPEIASTPSPETPSPSSSLDDFMPTTPTPIEITSSAGPHSSSTSVFFRVTPTSNGVPPNGVPPLPSSTNAFPVITPATIGVPPNGGSPPPDGVPPPP